jgi:hypothetical protein
MFPVRYGLNSCVLLKESNILIPVCWLEVSLHPEGLSIDQLDDFFFLFSSMLVQILSWYPIPTLHFKLYMQPSQRCCQN